MDALRRETARQWAPDDGRLKGLLRRDVERATKKRLRQAQLRELRAECADANEFGRRGCEQGIMVSQAEGRRLFQSLGG